MYFALQKDRLQICIQSTSHIVMQGLQQNLKLVLKDFHLRFLKVALIPKFLDFLFVIFILHCVIS